MKFNLNFFVIVATLFLMYFKPEDTKFYILIIIILLLESFGYLHLGKRKQDETDTE
jgi:formate/nitrite transporter FocA (FNT family)